MLTKTSFYKDEFARIISEHQQQSFDVSVSLAVFADTLNFEYWDKPLNEISPLILESHGQSALLESACKYIDEVGERLAATTEAERPEKVVFVLLTAGQDSVSDLQYTKALLQEKIQHQQNVYSWEFLFSDIDTVNFHSTVVRISKPVKKTTFQFAADIFVAENETVETIYEKLIDYVYEWINLKLGASTPERKQFSEGVDFDKFILPSLRCVSIPDEGHWCCRLIHADETTTNDRQYRV
jgi:hypothetical protein